MKTNISRYLFIKKMVSLIAIVLAMLLASCSVISEEKPTGGKTEPPISAVPQAGQTNKYTASLYFRYADEYLLSSETRVMDIPSNERIEATIVRALIKGPLPANTELYPVINPKTKVGSVSDNGEFLFITLSKDFLLPFGDEPQDYLTNPDWTEKVWERQRLGLYSIINTLTELGQFSSIQVFVDVDGTGYGQRIKLKDAGFAGDPDEEQPLEPQLRQDSLILTPGRALENTLKLLMDRDYSKAYGYLNQKYIQDGLTEEQLKEALNGSDKTLEDFDIVGENVSGDGKSAIVTIDCTVAGKNGDSVHKSAIPMRLVRVNECWKLTYEALGHIYSLSAK
ncbi:MAG: GerMN domain-containing protein [Bacillota bacterium]|nr:GerMN domain-containing protein [Bacillota bacterium]